MAELAALGIRPPQINALGAFGQGAQTALGMQQAQQGMAQSAQTHQSNMQNAEIARQSAKQEQALKAMQIIGSVAMGAMDGNLRGQVDPEKFDQGLNILEGYGIDVSQFRGKPEIAPVVAQSSLTALQRLQAAQSDREYDLALQEFELDVMKATQPKPVSASSPLGKLKQDFDAGLLTQEQYDAAVKKATQSSQGITVSPDGTVQIGGSPTFQKESDKKDAEAIQTIRDEAGTAQELRSIATQMETVSPDLGYTGPGGQVYGSIDDILGILPGEKGARGAFRQMSMDAQLAMTQKTKGAITDREMGMFKQAVPGLTQTQEGNKAMVNIMKAAASRLEQRATFFENYKARAGTLNGATEAWGKFLDENPLIESDGGAVKFMQPKKSPDEYLPKTQEAQPAAGQPQEITTKDEYDALPSGSQFMWKGQVGVKP